MSVADFVLACLSSVARQQASQHHGRRWCAFDGPFRGYEQSAHAKSYKQRATPRIVPDICTLQQCRLNALSASTMKQICRSHRQAMYAICT
eukprot:927988-Pleurochrysis_carterae.AAC.2